MNPAIVVVIPARYASTRLPGKPIVDIAGKPMVVRVAERAREVATIQRVIIATDDQRVFDAVAAHGHEVHGLELMMTSPDHTTGTDRLAEVAARLDAEIIVNVQGDEPLIEPATIEVALAPLLADDSILMATTAEPIESAADLLNPNVVKVVTNAEGFALYFSRNPIPFPRASVQRHGSLEAAFAASPELLQQYSKHTGMYVYRRDFLLRYAKLPPTPLEQTELLEQLRALEHGYRIKVVKVNHRSIGVDTPEDLERVRQIFRELTSSKLL